MKRRLWLLMLFLLAGHVPAASADSACEGRFVNPITDICWSCIFPLSLGSIKVSQGTYDNYSTGNPTELECQILSRCLIYTSTENTDCRCGFYVISPRPGREYKIQTSYGNEAASGCQGKKSLVHPVCCLV